MSTSAEQPRIIVALDQPTDKAALDCAKQLDPVLCRVKIGSILFTKYGPRLLEQLMQLGFSVFLDLKFHDIPQTVAGACYNAAELGVWMINIHISGGKTMLAQVYDILQTLPEERRPLLIGVTVLTSLTQQDLLALGIGDPIEQLVLRMAKLAQESGLDGVVCSGQEAAQLRAMMPKNFLLITPGIRLPENDHEDQKRVVTPQAAFAAGADYLVIGRPITHSPHPRMVLEKICAQMTK